MNFWYSLITRWTRWTFFLQSSAHLKLKANFVQPFLRPPPCQKTSICQNMKKLGEREILFPVSSQHQVLIKNSKTALLQKKLDIKHAETNIADVTREVGLKQSWHIVSVINSTISLFPPPLPTSKSNYPILRSHFLATVNPNLQDDNSQNYNLWFKILIFSRDTDGSWSNSTSKRQHWMRNPSGPPGSLGLLTKLLDAKLIYMS